MNTVLLENLHDALVEIVADEMDTALKTAAALHFTVKYVPELGTPEQQIKAGKDCIDRLRSKDRLQGVYDTFIARHFHPSTIQFNKPFFEQAKDMLEVHFHILSEALNEIKKPLNRLLLDNNGTLQA